MTYRLYRLEELRELPQHEWLISGVLHQGTLASLYGQPKTGKSFLALDLAAAIATGTSWCGHEVTQGEVVYICSEGASAFLKRITARLPAADLATVPLLVLPRSVPITNESEVSELIAAIEAIGTPRLVIVDTLARNFGGANENASDEMNKFVAGLDRIRARFSATVLVVHHEGKNRDGGMRGSSVLLGAMDTGMYLSRQGNVVTLKSVAQKDMEDFAVKKFRLEQVRLADGESTCALRYQAGHANDNSGVNGHHPIDDPAPGEEREESHSANMRLAEEALAEIGGSGRRRDWLAGFLARGPSESTFKRVCAKLIDRGRVLKTGHIYAFAEQAALCLRGAGCGLGSRCWR